MQRTVVHGSGRLLGVAGSPVVCAGRQAARAKGLLRCASSFTTSSKSPVPDSSSPPPAIDASYALYPNHRPTSLFQKGLLAAGSALAAIINPERADMVATLGETTGPFALRALHAKMVAHPIGREILHTKPRLRIIRIIIIIIIIIIIQINTDINDAERE
jgi:hypothetical protein